MHPITKPLALLRRWRQLPTGATLLRRTGGWDRDPLHAGTVRLAVQAGEESAPADITDIMGSLRRLAARDGLTGQGLVGDHARLADEPTGDLVGKVAARVGDMPVLRGEPLHRLLAPIAPLLLASDRPLGASSAPCAPWGSSAAGNLAPIRRLPLPCPRPRTIADCPYAP